MVAVMAMREELFGTFALVTALSVIGWGFGFAAALARRSFQAAVEGVVRRHVWVAGALLATLIAVCTLYAYLVVLSSVGIVDYCDPVAFRAC